MCTYPYKFQWLLWAMLLGMMSNSLAQSFEIIVHTGQHFDKNMSDIFFEEMQIPKPAYNLNIHSLSHGAMTGQMLENIDLSGVKYIFMEQEEYDNNPFDSIQYNLNYLAKLGE